MPAAAPSDAALVSTKQSPRASRDHFFAYHGIWAPGVRLFRQLHLTAKAMIISLAFMLPILAVLGWQLHAQYEQALQARKDAVRQLVEVASGELSTAHAKQLSGALTQDQAQQYALSALSQMRYGNGEYFWVNDMHPRVVMHPIKPKLNGKDVSGVKDPNGLALFQAFVDTVRQQGEGYVSYQWPKAGQDEPEDKVSYVKGFEPWGWVVGTGLYVGDLRQAALNQAAWVGGIIALALLFSGYLFSCFYRVLDGGLRETRRHLQAMKGGDLTTRPVPWGSDEASELMNDLAQMQDSLHGMVMRVRSSSDEIVHSTSEIAAGAKDLATRTEQSAANLEQSAAGMEEIASTVSSTAENIQQASKVAKENAQSALEGGNVIREVVQTMEEIHSSSTKIHEIINTIDGITFQTNLLALNAAVEAARAGEQGRGFAVVANEVRTLAQRSAEAAQEIKELITKSVEQVDAGTHIVRRAEGSIGSILNSSQEVDQLLGHVATAAQEQSLGVSDLGQSLQQLDDMTQQNAALVEETAAGAGSMMAQAHTLSQAVSSFKIPAGTEHDDSDSHGGSTA